MALTLLTFSGLIPAEPASDEQQKSADAAVARVVASQHLKILEAKYPATHFIVMHDYTSENGEYVYLGGLVEDDGAEGHTVRWESILVTPDGTMRQEDIATCTLMGEPLK